MQLASMSMYAVMQMKESLIVQWKVRTQDSQNGFTKKITPVTGFIQECLFVQEVVVRGKKRVQCRQRSAETENLSK